MEHLLFSFNVLIGGSEKRCFRVAMAVFMAARLMGLRQTEYSCELSVSLVLGAYVLMLVTHLSTDYMRGQINAGVEQRSGRRVEGKTL